MQGHGVHIGVQMLSKYCESKRDQENSAVSGNELAGTVLSHKAAGNKQRHLTLV